MVVFLSKIKDFYNSNDDAKKIVFFWYHTQKNVFFGIVLSFYSNRPVMGIFKKPLFSLVNQWISVVGMHACQKTWIFVWHHTKKIVFFWHRLWLGGPHTKQNPFFWYDTKKYYFF